MASSSPLHTSILLFHLVALFTATATTLPPLPHQPGSTTPPPPGSGSPQPVARQHQEPQQMPILAPILANLGFQELAMAVPTIHTPFFSTWSGPLTIFAPSDDSVRSCLSCSPSLLLREHLVPGLYSHLYLSKLAFGTKLETTSPGRCLTITSSAVSPSGINNGSTPSELSKVKIFIDGIEITRPDLFNDGRIVIHGLQGFVTPISPLSCNQDIPGTIGPNFQPSEGPGSAIVRLMMRDAIVRLRDGGFSILALAMRVKYAELASLQNMTIFALDDSSIFAGGHSYVTSVRYHVVPNRFLMHADLLKLPAGTSLPTLVHGQDLVITHTSGGDPIGLGFRINYVPIKRADVVYNIKIAVHSVFLPFPHLQPSDLALAAGSATDDGIFEPADHHKHKTCHASPLEPGNCITAGGPSTSPIASSPADFEDEGF